MNYLAYLKKNAATEGIVFALGKSRAMRQYFRISDVTEDQINYFIETHRSVSFGVFDIPSFAAGLQDYCFRMKDNGDTKFENFTGLPDKPVEIFEYLNSTPVSYSIRSEHVTKKPFIMVDMDLADNKEALRKAGLIDEVEYGYDLKSFKLHIVDLSVDRKKAMIEGLLSMPAIETDTQPVAALFSGNGLHLWYAYPNKMDQYMYSHFHGTLVEKLSHLHPDVKFDMSAGKINQLLRIPGSYNEKGVFPVQCEFIHEAAEYEVSDLVKEAKNTFSRAEVKKKANDRTNISKLIQNFEANKSPIYRGFRHIQMDERLFYFVKKYMTYDVMCAYMGMPVENRTDYDEYFVVSSPLRQDNNPSFMVSPSRMICRDLGRNDEEYDFGELMAEFIAIKMDEFNIPGDVSRYVAQLHCVMCAFLEYLSETEYKTQTFPFMNPHVHLENMRSKAADMGLKNIPAEWKVIPGTGYYNGMVAMLHGLMEYRNKNYGSSFDLFREYLIRNMPPIYFFYDNRAHHNSTHKYMMSMLALTTIDFLNDLKIGVQIIENTQEDSTYSKQHINVYAQMKNSTLHVPWVVAYSGNDEGRGAETRNTTKATIALSRMNVTEAGRLPSNVKSSQKLVIGVFGNLANLPARLKEHLPEERTDMALRTAISKAVNEIQPELHISPKDLNAIWLDDNHYIEFKNCYVLYSSRDTGRIGEVVEKTPENNYALRKRSVIDIAIPHLYIEDGKETPLFNKFLKTMTYNDNKFEQAMRYLFGSMLYPPLNTNPRAIFLWGLSGDNGKSVIAQLFKSLLGEHLITEKPIADISKTNDQAKNARYEMMDSVLNISPDTANIKLEPTFKTLVSGEAVQVRKLYEAERDVCLRCHYIVNTNSLPQIWGEANPFAKRVLIIKLHRKIPVKQQIPDLAIRILNTEASRIWPWIIQQAKLFKEKGILGFFEAKELQEMDKETKSRDELYQFVDRYVVISDSAKSGLNGQKFKSAYNKYRQYIDKGKVLSDSILDEALAFIRDKFENDLSEKILDKGFTYRRGDSRGLPLRIYVPVNEVGNILPIDSEE